MRKIFILLAVFAFTFALAGCEKIVEVEVEKIVEVEVEVEVPMEWPDIPAVVDMDNIDEFLGRPDVQYVDLRDFDDKMSAGYIAGFEMIPFLAYLEATNILIRTDDDFIFAAEDIISANALRALFNEDKTIFLMCGSGTRAEFVLEALEELGYTDVINIGGTADYLGDHMVSGDSTYNLEVQLPLPAVVDMDNIDLYLGRSDVQYVDLRNFDDKMSAGYIAGFEFIPFFDYLENTGILVRTDGNWIFDAADIVSAGAMNALFDENKTIFLMCGSGTRAEFVLEALEELGYTDVINIGGTADVDVTADYWVPGDGVYTVEVVVPGTYTPGVYYGSSDILYNVVVVINSAGGIQSVFFDAVTCLADSDADGIKDSNCTTKQTLGDDYGMVTYGGAELEWYEQANELAAAIIAAQGWNADWEIIVDGDDESFDPTDQEVIDDVAGVTITTNGFQDAFEDAIAQATPAS